MRPKITAGLHTGVVPSTLPPGDPAPADGSLPSAALAGLGERPFGVYVHVPFCAVRCGYCDFNTYTATELGAGVSRATYADTVIAELRLAAAACRVLRRVPPVSTVFVGGGTPTLLPADDLVRVLAAVARPLFGLAADAEVTTEANPDSVDARLAGAAARRRLHPHLVRHAVGGAARAARRSTARTTRRARAAAVAVGAGGRLRAGQPRPDPRHAGGVAGATGRRRSTPRWRCEPDHVWAYALIVEDGTALARRVARGEVPMPDDDDLADKYLLADEAARRRRATTGTSCPTGRAHPGDAVPAQPRATGTAATGGASVRARTRTSGACGGGTSSTRRRTPSGSPTGPSPALAREVLDDETRRVERILLETRLVDGLAGRRARPTRAGAGCRTWSPTGWSRTTPGPVVLTTAGPAAGRRRRPRPGQLTKRMVNG